QTNTAVLSKGFHFYNAACSAARVSCGRSKDGNDLGLTERTAWRQQALAWLEIDLRLIVERLDKSEEEERIVIQRTLDHWLDDDDLADVRNPLKLASLSAPERLAW